MAREPMHLLGMAISEISENTVQQQSANQEADLAGLFTVFDVIRVVLNGKSRNYQTDSALD